MLPAVRALKVSSARVFSSSQTGERPLTPRESTQIVSAIVLTKSGGTIDRTVAISELCGSVKRGASLFIKSLSGDALARDQSKYATDVQIRRDKLMADKRLLVAITMDLSDAEAIGFWPIFEAYQKDLEAIDDRLMKTIMSFADAYNNSTLTDEIAMKIFDETMAIFNDEIKIGKDYSAKLVGVLPGKKAVRYLQIEGKIRAEMWCELAAEIPLME
ncbi:MAG: hypothetical protein L0220_30375 [Acidobacteria bacterium]|nr:hypothetical protein [Acidobacteriota bacterium]